MTSALSVERISKTYGDIATLREISFDVAYGEVVVLLGPNGAGKSTLLNCIVGAIKPSSGNVLILGQPFFQVSDLVHSVGFVRGSSGLDKGFRVKNAMHLAAIACGEERQRENQLLEDCGISHLRNQKIKNLSTGEKQRLAIAIGILPNPKILILDEPQNGLDAEGIIWFRKLIRRFSENGGSVLLATHYLAEVELVADKVAIINHKLIKFDSMANFLSEGFSSMEESYLQIIASSRPGSEES